jgi:hypothetical protein
MEKLHANIRTIFKNNFHSQPLADYKHAQEFVQRLLNLGYRDEHLAEATNCDPHNFTMWRRWGHSTQYASRNERVEKRVQTWLNQHLETDIPKALPADIPIWVALASARDKLRRVYVAFDSRVQDIPKFLFEEKTFPIQSELDIESFTLGEETLEWTRLCSSYSFAYPNLVLVHLSTE